MRKRQDFFFDSAEQGSLGEIIPCPEGGEPLVVEDEGDGRKLAFCYRHVIACYVGKGWDKEKADRSLLAPP